MDANELVERVAREISASTLDWGDEEPEVWETHRILARAALREIVAAAGGAAAMMDDAEDLFARNSRNVAALLRALAEGGKDA